MLDKNKLLSQIIGYGEKVVYNSLEDLNIRQLKIIAKYFNDLNKIKIIKGLGKNELVGLLSKYVLIKDNKLYFLKIDEKEYPIPNLEPIKREVKAKQEESNKLFDQFDLFQNNYNKFRNILNKKEQNISQINLIIEKITNSEIPKYNKLNKNELIDFKQLITSLNASVQKINEYKNQVEMLYNSPNIDMRLAIINQIFQNQIENINNRLDDIVNKQQIVKSDLKIEPKEELNKLSKEKKKLYDKINKLKDTIDKPNNEDNLNQLRQEADKILTNIDEFLKVKDKEQINRIDKKEIKFSKLTDKQKIDYIRMFPKKYAEEIVSVPSNLYADEYDKKMMARDPYRIDESMDGLIERALQKAKNTSNPLFTRRFQRLKILAMVDYLPEIKKVFGNDYRINELRKLGDKIEPKRITKPKKDKKKKEKKIIEEIPPDPRFVVDNREDIIKVVNLLIKEPEFKKWAVDGEISLSDVPENLRNKFEEAEAYLNDIWGSQINKQGNEWTIIEFIEKLQSEEMSLDEILKNLKAKHNK